MMLCQPVPSTCSDLSTNNTLNLTIGYIRDKCYNRITELLEISEYMKIQKALIWYQTYVE